jgi:hypothetical protein
VELLQIKKKDLSVQLVMFSCKKEKEEKLSDFSTEKKNK